MKKLLLLSMVAMTTLSFAKGKEKNAKQMEETVADEKPQQECGVLVTYYSLLDGSVVNQKYFSVDVPTYAMCAVYQEMVMNNLRMEGYIVTRPNDILNWYC